MLHAPRAFAPAPARTGRVVAASLLACLALGAASTAVAGPITIGRGPLRGVDRAGVSWYEEFQDWTAADLRALDDAGSTDARYDFGDGLDDSRDLVAFYSRTEGANVYFRADFYDLALGAENGALDLYVAIDAAPGGQTYLPDFLDCTTDRPWEIAVCLYRSGTNQGSDYQIYDAGFTPVTGAFLGSYWNSQLDAVEFGITRQALIDAGWNGSSPLTFQVFTTKDGAETNCGGGGASSDLTDAFVDQDRGCSDGVLNGGILSTDRAGFVWFSSIAHGNQSVNQADDIGAHIYDPEANTHIAGGTGFLRTLDTHRIFRVPINLHPSGTLTVACNWAVRPGGAADPQDGPSFLAQIREFVDANQADTPGALIGGVFAEHIMPYFEGAVNAASIALTDSLDRAVYGVRAADARIMHVPERVIRSQNTGQSPLDGRTFEDIAASPYVATYLDEVTHLHRWFYPGESCEPDAGYRHKVHRINGVYCFMINDREDGRKFSNYDGGMDLDTRYSLLQKARFGQSSEIVVVFDDWEALAGKSFDATSGNSVPNNNPNQYHNTIRWAANHPWIRIATLADILDAALANPAGMVIDHGMRFDLPIQTYEWLAHATEDSYHNWYYDQNAGFPGNEQSFYDLVPVITGAQGDYHARNATPASDGPPLPSGSRLGDLNTPGTLMFEAWKALTDAPAGRLRELGVDAYLAMIYETAWHEEDAVQYGNGCLGPWDQPDASWDGVNTWALRLQNHVRGAGVFAAAARWADSVRAGAMASPTRAYAADLDFDGEPEYVIRNPNAFVVAERYGGRCVLAVVWDPVAHDGDVIVGAPFSNPSSPGEEELVGASANRCSAFKDMNDGIYADAPDAAVAIAGGWRFTSPDGKVQKRLTIADGTSRLEAAYAETVAGPLAVRLGLSPNPRDLAFHGPAHLSRLLTAAACGPLPGPSAPIYQLVNTEGGAARVTGSCGVQFNPTPAFAGSDRRNLPLTEEVEFSGDGSFSLTLELVPTQPGTTGVSAAPPPLAFAVHGPTPSPARGAATITFALPARANVRVAVVDLAGRVVRAAALGTREPGETQWTISRSDAAGHPLSPGLYFVRVEAGDRAATRRWVVL